VLFLSLRHPPRIFYRSYRDFIRRIRIAASVGVLAFSFSAPIHAAGAGDNNVLLITLDTLRYDRVSFHSQTYVHTPNIDRLAARAAVFHRAFAHNPVTLPSHTNILTGTTPLHHGISDNPGFKLEDRFLTLAEHLREAGFKTAAFIAAFPLDSRFGLNQGFDLYDDNFGIQNLYSLYFAERRAEEVIKPAMDWISRQSDQWFVWVHLFDPHEPYDPPAPFKETYAEDLYSGEAAYTDAQLGILFEFLERRDLMSHTVIVLTSDHGEGRGEHGEYSHSYFAYNTCLHVPLMVYVPDRSPAEVNENVSHVDIFPTVCDVLGIGKPKHLQGESLLPLIQGKTRVNSSIYFESMTPYLTAGWAPLRGFIRGGLKYIDLPIKEVYDLYRDMAEDSNLAETSNLVQLDKDLKQIRKKLRGKVVEQKLDTVEQDTLNKMRTLGYMSSGKSEKQKSYTAKDDLKSLLPLQTKIISATKNFRAGEHDHAMQKLQDVIQARPDYVPAYGLMANLLSSLGRKESAVETLREGLKANKNSLFLQSRLGLMLVEVKNYDESIKLLERCIAREDTNPDHFIYLGVAHQKSGRYETALENYRKALRLDKSNVTAYNNIGSVHLIYFLRTKDLKQYELAMANFNNALAFNPFFQAALNGRQAADKFKAQLENRIKSPEKSIR